MKITNEIIELVLEDLGVWYNQADIRTIHKHAKALDCEEPVIVANFICDYYELEKRHNRSSIAKKLSDCLYGNEINK